MEPSEYPQNYKWGIFYYNPDDSRTVVPKREKSLGWTFNFAKARTYAFIGIAVLIIVLINYIANNTAT
jgi:uncharacterized membrane protein